MDKSLHLSIDDHSNQSRNGHPNMKIQLQGHSARGERSDAALTIFYEGLKQVHQFRPPPATASGCRSNYLRSCGHCIVISE